MLDILIFAAGSSSRMGGTDKLVQLVHGQPLLTWVASQALKTGHPVTVLLDPNRPARVRALGDLAVRHVMVPDAGDGMAHSIRAGIGSLPEAAKGAMFMMADMPDLRQSDLLRLIETFKNAGQTQVVRAAAEDGTPGSPSVVPRRLFPAFFALIGDQGGRAAMHGEDVILVPLPGRRALTDLDAPEDWAAWRALNESET